MNLQSPTYATKFTQSGPNFCFVSDVVFRQHVRPLHTRSSHAQTSRRRDATATMISNVNTNNPAVKRIMREAREVHAATPATHCLRGCVHHAT